MSERISRCLCFTKRVHILDRQLAYNARSRVSSASIAYETVQSAAACRLDKRSDILRSFQLADIASVDQDIDLSTLISGDGSEFLGDLAQLRFCSGDEDDCAGFGVSVRLCDVLSDAIACPSYGYNKTFWEGNFVGINTGLRLLMEGFGESKPIMSGHSYHHGSWVRGVVLHLGSGLCGQHLIRYYALVEQAELFISRVAQNFHLRPAEHPAIYPKARSWNNSWMHLAATHLFKP